MVDAVIGVVKVDKQYATERERWPAKREHDVADPSVELRAGKATLLDRAHAGAPPHEVGKRTLVEHTLYRHAEDGGDVDLEAPSVTQALERAGSGQALPTDVRANLEGELGYALGRVRVHTDDVAAGAARSLRAEAFTVGEDIYFARGRFAPETREGRKLIAHEVTHVVQAWEGRTQHGGGRRVSDPSSSLEREAVATSERVGPRAPAPAPRAAPASPMRGGGLVMRNLDRSLPSVDDEQGMLGENSPIRARITLLTSDVHAVLNAMPATEPARPVANLPGLTLANAYVPASPDVVRTGTRTMQGSTLTVARSRLGLPTSYRWAPRYMSTEEKALTAELTSLGKALEGAKKLVNQAKASAVARTRTQPAAGAALTELEAKVTELEAEVAAKRAELEATSASHEENQKLQLSGDTTANEFWCSGFVMWTLAASGYNLTAPLLRTADQKPYLYRRGAQGRPHTITLKALIDGEADAVEAMIRFEHDPLAGDASGIVELVEGEDTLVHGGHRDGYGPDGIATAVKGVAGALELFGIGKAVDPSELKPGDFVQQRHPTATYEADLVYATAQLAAVTSKLKNKHLSADEKAALEATQQVLDARKTQDEQTKKSAGELPVKIQAAQRAVKQAKDSAARAARRSRGAAPASEAVSNAEAKVQELETQLAALDIHMEQVGAGHIWQVNAVVAKGAALFGAPGSPKLLGRAAPTEPTWITDADFVIGADTQPALVGAHVVERQQRLEANFGTTDKQGNVTRADGVAVSKALESKTDGDSVTASGDQTLFCGRIESSPWNAWQEATEDSARAFLTSAASAEPAPAPTPAPAPAPAPTPAPAPAPTPAPAP